jgi:hypothetical protein
MSEEKKLITVGQSQLTKKEANFVWYAAFGSYYTYAYTTIPSDLTNEPLSICFLITIIITWLRVIRALLEIRTVFAFWGSTMHSSRWEAELPGNRFPLAYLKTLELLDLGLGIYFMVLFTTISSSNCNIYSNTPHACKSMQILTVLTYIETCFFGFLILCLCCCSPCILVALSNASANNEPSPSDRIFNQRNPPLGAVGSVGSFRSGSFRSGGSMRNLTGNQYANALITKYLPITSTPPNDNTCAICIEDHKEGDQWKTLPCGHKYHPTCIQPWITQNTCPHCRKPILQPGEVLGV